jgi:hypothetical protein
MAKPFHPRLFMFYNQQWNKNTVTWRQSQGTDDTATQTTNIRPYILLNATSNLATLQF